MIERVENLPNLNVKEASLMLSLLSRWMSGARGNVHYRPMIRITKI
ncbi:MAG TPA: hypothetical protein VFG09_09735 [Thermodesulfovibrionales bacterium]|jgi:hypothetical protein|nr:hypothetical protein [Thermodesulfovibrionales bacterium]